MSRENASIASTCLHLLGSYLMEAKWKQAGIGGGRPENDHLLVRIYTSNAGMNQSFIVKVETLFDILYILYFSHLIV